jgi:hypothetical protein
MEPRSWGAVSSMCLGFSEDTESRGSQQQVKRVSHFLNLLDASDLRVHHRQVVALLDPAVMTYGIQYAGYVF